MYGHIGSIGTVMIVPCSDKYQDFSNSLRNSYLLRKGALLFWQAWRIDDDKVIRCFFSLHIEIIKHIHHDQAMIGSILKPLASKMSRR